jgi:hypothetical protein
MTSAQLMVCNISNLPGSHSLAAMVAGLLCVRFRKGMWLMCDTCAAVGG